MPRDTATLDASAGTAHDDLRSLEAGLDRLQTDAEHTSSRWRRIASSVIPPVVFVLLLIVAWQLYVVIAQPRPDRVPSPLDVWNALGLAWETGRLQEAVSTSSARHMRLVERPLSLSSATTGRCCHNNAVIAAPMARIAASSVSCAI